jgi:D-alanine-D-alanine ligase
MRITAAVIKTGDFSRVTNRTCSTREWEAYDQNASEIADALRRLGHDVRILEDGFQLSAELHDFHPDIAWICSGGIQGRDQAAHLPGLLETMGIRYVGAPPLAAAMADNKYEAKMAAIQSGVPTPDFRLITSVAELNALLQHPPAFPLIVKPVCGMCSCGVYRVGDELELENRAFELLDRYRSDVLVEDYVDGIDLALPLIDTPRGIAALPAMRRNLQSIDLPDDGTCRLPHPRSTMREGEPISADMGEVLSRELLSHSMKMFRRLRLRHFARIDYRIDGDRIFMLEVTHKPDLTESGVFARSALADGIDYVGLIDGILSTAMLRESSPRHLA